jgi:hypothetical protein
MKKIKITESQKNMLESKAAAKLKEDISYSQSGSKAVSDEYRKAGANKILGMKVEGIEETTKVSMSELAPKVLDFIKQLYTNPSKEALDPFWESLDIEWDELIQLLTELKLIKSVSGGYRLQKLERVGGPTAVVKIVSKLVQKLISNKNTAVEEDIDLSKDMNPSDMFKGMVDDWLKKFTNNRVELLNNKGEFKDAWLTIRKIGKNATRKPQLEEDNYPMGADNDPNAPWNQEDLPAGKGPKQQIIDLQLWVDEYAFFTKDGKLFVYNVESADNDEYEEYASREETYLGRDEDGMPDVEYGEWEMDEDIINAYVNDNLEHLSTGKGLDAWENGTDLVEVDQALAQDLLRVAKYIRDPKTAESFVKTLKSIGLDEMTSAAGSSGAFVGKLGSGGNAPIAKSNVAPEIDNIISDDVVETGSTLKSDIVSALKRFTLDKDITPSEWLSFEGDLKMVVDLIQHLDNQDWSLMIRIIIKSLQHAEEVTIGQHGSISKFKSDIDELIGFIQHMNGSIDEASTTITVGGDSGTFAYDSPAGDGSDFWTKGNKQNKSMPLVKKGAVKEMVAREGKDAKTDTQWPGGQFVEFDDCVKYNNNKVAQNGGCSTGAVDNVVKTKGSKNSVISDSSIYESIAKETGRTIEEVKSILSRKNKKTK